MKIFVNKSLITFLTIAFAILVQVSYAQESTIKKFEVNGLKVIYKPSVKDVISVRLFIEGGTANYPKEKEGIENLSLHTAVEGGTTHLAKIPFSMEAEKIGTEFNASASHDFGVIDMECIKMYWDKSWELFADMVQNPAFDANEFSLIKEKLITQAQQQQADPDTYLDILAAGNTFKGGNYAKIPSGTPESLKKISLEEAKNYYNKMLGKKSIFLVVVGNVTEQDLKAKISATLAKLPEGTAVVKSPRSKVNTPEIVIEDRDIATNYISGVMLAPAALDKESIAMRVAIAILRDRFFLELRTNRALSYAPSAYHLGNRIVDPYNVLYISTLDPKTSIHVMVDEINKIRIDGFSPKELKDKKQTFLTYYFLNLETNSAQSLGIGTQEMAGDYKLFETLTQRVNNLSLEDLNKAFKKYSTMISWTYLGKKDMVANEDFIQPSLIGEESLKMKK